MTPDIKNIEDISSADLQQVNQILNEIASLAIVLDEHLLNAVGEGSKEAGIMRPLANQLGFLSEIGIGKISNSVPIRGSAENWFMAPAFRK